MKAGLRFSDADKLEPFLKDISTSTEAAKDKFLKRAGKETKNAVQKHIPRDISVPRRNAGRVRLVDNVTDRLVPDKDFGGKKMRVSGGKATGTLWHVVDGGGRWNRKPTNFMDKAIADVDGVLDPLLDIAMSEEFGR